MNGLAMVLILASVLGIIGILLYVQLISKEKNLEKLQNGECPDCGEVSSNEKKVITFNTLKAASCDGIKEVKYTCNVCGCSHIFSEHSVGSCDI
jgi:ribosomal protein S27AE